MYFTFYLVSWVLGEYGYLSQSFTKEEVMTKLCQLAINSAESSTKSHIITALMKLCAQSGSCPQNVHQLVNLYSKSMSLDLQQRCIEFKALINSSEVMVDALPVDASCEDLDVDEQLSFLAEYVRKYDDDALVCLFIIHSFYTLIFFLFL